MSLSEYDAFLNLYGTFYGGEVRKPRVRDNTFSKEGLPSLREQFWKALITDPDIKKFQKSFTPDTIVNRTVLALADNTFNSYSEMAGSIMFGDSVTIAVDGKDGEKCKEIIDVWNDNINMKHDTIEKFMKTSLKDAFINREFLYRVYINPNATGDDPKVDIQRVSMATLQRDEHETLGAVRWIQRATIFKKPMDKMRFYRRDPLETIQRKEVIVIIPNEINCCLHLELFDQAPVSTILKELNSKQWAYMFLRKFMEKFWAPFILAYVGDPKNGYMPRDPVEMKDQLNWAAQQIRMIRDFGGAAFPATTKLEPLETGVSKVSNIYLDTINHLSKEIAIGLHASITTRESDKTSKAGQDISMQGYLRGMRSTREAFNILLRRFYAQVLLPAYGKTGKKPRDIKITFSEIQTDDIKKIAEAAEIAAKIGVFKDWREVRKIFKPIWKHIDENLTDEEAKEMKKLFLELNSPSRAEGDVPQKRAGTTSTKPKK